MGAPTTTDEFLRNYRLEGRMLDILAWPDPVLTRKAEPVATFDDGLREFARDLLHTLYHSPGIGLAAPQVGRSERIFVVDVDYERESTEGEDGENPPPAAPESPEERYRRRKEEDPMGPVVPGTLNPRVFVNPVFKKKEGETVFQEGCLSVPGVYEEVRRCESVVMEYRDLEGNPRVIEAKGLLSICLQHENDHLDGVVFIERLGAVKRELVTKRYLKSRRTEARRP